MSFSYKGYVLDPSKCSKLSIEEKRELVYEIAKCSHATPEMLQSWSRQELLQILCAEMGKENKYKSLPKKKIIERLMIRYSKNSRKRIDGPDLESKPLPLNSQTTSKRQRKSENPVRLAVDNVELAKYCQNPACRGTIYPEDDFCKLCSCYICHQYDYNKDPSLWLFCCPGPSNQDDSCDMSCHLECVFNFKHERAIATDANHAKLDVSCYCVSCGKVHDLVRCLRNQLLTAKDTTQVEVLRYRLSLSQKLLQGTKKYQKMHDLVEQAVMKMEAEVELSSGLPVSAAEAKVSSLSNGSEVQKLCASAVELLDSILACGILPASNPKLQDSSLTSPSLIRFKNVSPTSVTVVLGFEDTTIVRWYNLWHRRADVVDYPAEPTCTLFTPQLRFTFFDLIPGAEYVMKVVSFCNLKELDMWEARFTTSSDGNNAVYNVVVERDHSSSTNSSSISNPSDGDESNNLSALKDKIEDPLGKYFGCNNTQMPDSSKLSDDANKGISESQYRSNDSRQEETPENSVSGVNDECIMEEVKSMPNVNVFHRSSTGSTERNQAPDSLQPEKNHSLQGQSIKKTSTYTGYNTPVGEGLEIVPFEYGSDDTSCGIGDGKYGSRKSWRQEPGKIEFDDLSWKKEEQRDVGMPENRIKRRFQEPTTAESPEEEYIHCVKVIRSLERKRYIEKNFREKFLSWYSLRAAKEERKMVKVLVDTLKEKPLSLSGKLIETFSEKTFSKRPPASSSEFCMEIWH